MALDRARDGLERFRVGRADVLGAARVFHVRVFRPDAGIIEARRNRVRFGDLAPFILHDIAQTAVQNALGTSVERRGVFIRIEAVARRSIAARAVPLVLAMAAVSDDLIYYSTEFKQYMSDLVIALGCLLLARDLEERELTPRRLAMAAGLGVAATWSSLPSVFLLAGAGPWLAIRALSER